LGDKIGLRLAGIVFVSLVVAGSVLVALGPSLAVGGFISGSSGYIIMLLGRVVFGSGSESLNVIQTSMTSRWFRGTTYLAGAMGVVLSASRLGDFLALALESSLASLLGGYTRVLWLGVVLCGISMVSVLIYGLLDKASERYFPNRVQDPSENALNFKAVPHFDVRFWLVCVVCMCYYGGVFPLVTILSSFLEDEYHFDPVKAGWYSSIVTLASMILSPFLGLFLDKVGRRPYFVIIGSLTVIPAHLSFAFTHINPLIPICVIGLSFSLVPSALWPRYSILNGKFSSSH